MKIVRNLTYLLQGAGMAMTMNFLGLTLALCTFILLIAQVRFDSTFDAYHSDADRIYRVELEWQGKRWLLFLNQWLILCRNFLLLRRIR